MIISQADECPNELELVFSHLMHTDDTVGMGGVGSSKFLFSVTEKAREEFHQKVPSATSQVFFCFVLFSISLGWKVLNIELLRLDI